MTVQQETAAQRYDTARESFKAAGKLMKEVAKDALKEKFAAFFQLHPKIQNFGWMQYPENNYQGDSYIFTVEIRPDFITLNGTVWDGANEDEYDKSGVLTQDEAEEAATCISDILQEFEHDTFRKIFGKTCGKHKTITVNRDGTVHVSELIPF